MVKQYNYPTIILFGEGSTLEGLKRWKNMGFHSPLLVADQGLKKVGLVDQVLALCKEAELSPLVFLEVHPNPIEEDVLTGAQFYQDNQCDSVIALGGGSPMDAAKGIMIAATHPAPLAQYDDAIGGDKKIVNALPKLMAIPTTAGTGSEVGRCGVITLKESNNKTIFFHPTLMPTLAILEPEFTAGLPKNLTVATGIDAFTHSLEAYFAPGFDPMADGMAQESMKLVIQNLDKVASDGQNLEARGKMLLAATMGATAFQKGLGMIHSLAHPLSSECGLHHGLANALVTPACIEFIESQNLTPEKKERIARVNLLFGSKAKSHLYETLQNYYSSLGVEFGLRHHNVKEEDLANVAKKAFADVCHKTNIIPVDQEQLASCLRNAF